MEANQLVLASNWSWSRTKKNKINPDLSFPGDVKINVLIKWSLKLSAIYSSQFNEARFLPLTLPPATVIWQTKILL